MTNRHAAPVSFREWLVLQLLTTRWAAPSGLNHAQAAEHLGVTESVLTEAQALRAAEIAARGRPMSGKRRRRAPRYDYGVLRVGVPPVILAAWRAWVGQLQVSGSALLRSLVHQFLLTGQRPVTLDHGWLYRGVTYRATEEEHKTKVITRVTRGAQTALEHYADVWHVDATRIVRGLVIDLLEGRVQRLKIVAYGEMWGDPKRYLEPEAFR